MHGQRPVTNSTVDALKRLRETGRKPILLRTHAQIT
jgi:hypothetical protein